MCKHGLNHSCAGGATLWRIWLPVDNPRQPWRLRTGALQRSRGVGGCFTEVPFIFKEDNMKKRLLMILGALVILTVSGCGYNTMQTNEEAVKAAWGDVEATYQRRNDLIPNLVEVVKGYAKHERETLTAVTEARAKVGTIQMSKDMLDDPQALA